MKDLWAAIKLVSIVSVLGITAFFVVIGTLFINNILIRVPVLIIAGPIWGIVMFYLIARFVYN